MRIALMKGFHTEQLKVNTIDSPKRWWEVIDRTTGEIVPTEKWNYDKTTGEVVIETIPYHQYTTQAYVKQKLKKWCEDNPRVNIVRFTTFFISLP